MPSVKLALDHVNEHSNILRNYRLHMWWNDTEVSLSLFLYLLKLRVSFISATLPSELNLSSI